jgi:hypothetical protein
MATNTDIKDALLRKLNIKAAALYKRAEAMRKKLPMTVEDSIHLIGFQEGVKIGKYLSPEQVQNIRHLQTQFVQANSGVAQLAARRAKQHTNSKAVAREIRFPNEFKMTNPLLPTEKLQEARAMATIYPLLYVLENSMRDIIKRVMARKFGVDWWDTELTTAKLKPIHIKVAERMQMEECASWHQKRGSHPIDYTDFSHLETIILSKHEHFIPDIIGDREWFVQFMKELKPSRNVICHMNPLDSHNVADIRIRAKRWEKLVAAAKDRIP